MGENREIGFKQKGIMRKTSNREMGKKEKRKGKKNSRDIERKRGRLEQIDRQNENRERNEEKEKGKAGISVEGAI